MVVMEERDAVLEFWFPANEGKDLESHRDYWTWRMRGGADASIAERFGAVTERAERGECDGWAATPRGRLALIVVLDQFSRSVWRDSPRAFAQDPKAVALVREGLANGHYDALANVWEKTFCIIPLGHCEGPDHLTRLDLAVALAQKVLRDAPPHLKPLYAFQADQPALVREVIRAFGRHPHRNRILGRKSTPEEVAYLLRRELPHQRPMPKVG
jgi:uncharacterized protein (DUF924 family)